jgi:hypothetical protein
VVSRRGQKGRGPRARTNFGRCNRLAVHMQFGLARSTSDEQKRTRLDYRTIDWA